MSPREVLTARLDMVRRYLDRALDHVTEELYTWAPAEGMRTIQGQVLEIVQKEIELLDYAHKHGEGGWIEVEHFDGREKTLDGMRSVLREARQTTLAYIDSLSDEQLAAPVKFPPQWWEGLGLTELPFHEVITNIAMHEWYHTGQIYSYLWSTGDDPDKW